MGLVVSMLSSLGCSAIGYGIGSQLDHDRLVDASLLDEVPKFELVTVVLHSGVEYRGSIQPDSMRTDSLSLRLPDEGFRDSDRIIRIPKTSIECVIVPTTIFGTIGFGVGVVTDVAFLVWSSNRFYIGVPGT